MVNERGRKGLTFHLGYIGGDRRVVIVAIFLVCAIFAIPSLFIPPSIFPDPGWGFMAWRSYLEGAPFNTILAPDPADITRDRADFLGYWTPGQYVIPGLITLVGVPLGVAITVTVFISLLSCLLGWTHVIR